MIYPSTCIANRGGSLNERNYWLNTINSFDGEYKTYDEILFDRHCLGGCLTWYTEYNGTGTQFTVHNRLYVKKADSTPIKLVRKFYQMNTQNLIGYVDGDTYSIVCEEFDYRIDIQKCSSS
jgi:hypothetical protein